MTILAPMAIGKEIKMARVEKDLSQKELGKLVGCTQQDIYRYEKGLSIPIGNRLQKIAEVLGKEWKLQ